MVHAIAKAVVLVCYMPAVLLTVDHTQIGRIYISFPSNRLNGKTL